MQQHDLAIPIMPARSVADTLTFYRRLGFTGEARGPDDAYAILRRETVELHFFAHPELRPAESSAGCYIRVANVEKIYRAFASAGLPACGIPRLGVPEDKIWGMREFALVDPDGNLLRIGERIVPDEDKGQDARQAARRGGRLPTGK